MNVTPIEWTTFSANPLRYRDADGNVVHACVHASPGCQNCYAEKLAGRWGRKGGKFNVPTTSKLTPFLDENELHKMVTAKTIGGIAVSGSRCFIGDMTDIFGEWVSDELLDRLFAVMAFRHDITFQVLTKRADRMRAYLSAAERAQRIAECLPTFGTEREGFISLPLSNVWLGVSVENQQYADERIPHLLKTPAAIRFISAEPLLGPVLLDNGDTSWLTCHQRCEQKADGEYPDEACMSALETDKCFRGIDWVIVGGESGPGARPLHVDWIRSIVKQCRDASVPVFVKQLGAKPQDTGRKSGCQPGVMLDEYNVRVQLKDRKGGDIKEFPTSLQVREFPSAVRA